MFNYDPRTAYGYNSYPNGYVGFNGNGAIPLTSIPSPSATMASPEILQCLARLDAHMHTMTEMFRTVLAHNTLAHNTLAHNTLAQSTPALGINAYNMTGAPGHIGYGIGLGTGLNTAWGMNNAYATAHTAGAPWMAFGGGLNNSALNRGFSSNEIVRIRETESHICCDVFLPQLTAGDVEVEVNGTRIVCRTRVPVGPAGRWFTNLTQLPRGFEFFELPDGRIECSWLCPVTFQPKEVEATFRDGILSIFVNKVDVANTRHSVKVGKETTRRSASEMNS